MEAVTGILFLATFVEGIIKYIAGDGKPEAMQRKRTYLRYVSLALGVGLAVAYKVSIPELVGISSTYPLVDYALSGVIIGRGSNYLNDILKTFRKA